MNTRFTNLRLYEGRDAVSADELLKDPSLPVPWIASTPGDPGDGFDLKADEWDLKRYLAHPVVLFGHDHSGFVALPIGIGKAKIEDDNLRIDVTYDVDDDFARRVRAKALKGMMAGSVGWNSFEESDREGKEIRVRNELIEFSMVPVGMDPRALPKIQHAGMMQLKRAIDNYVAGVDEPDPAAAEPVFTPARDEAVFEQLVAFLGAVNHTLEQLPDVLEKALVVSMTEALKPLGLHAEPAVDPEEAFLKALLAE